MRLKEISEEHQHIKFKVSDIDYTMVFMQQNIDVFEDEIIDVIQYQRSVYSVVFAVSQYLENEDYQGDFYQSPRDHFGQPQYIEIMQLKTMLQEALFKHYQMYKPQCYVFHGNTPRLTRFYQKICSKPKHFLLDFESICAIGSDKNGFIVKTPEFYQEER